MLDWLWTVDGSEGSVCFDCATESRIKKILGNGGKFLQKEGENIS